MRVSFLLFHALLLAFFLSRLLSSYADLLFQTATINLKPVSIQFLQLKTHTLNGIPSGDSHYPILSRQLHYPIPVLEIEILGYWLG